MPKGFKGMNYEQIMMQQAQKQVESPVYCRFCGQDIKQPTNNSTNTDGKWHSPWELQHSIHYKCYDQLIFSSMSEKNKNR